MNTGLQSNNESWKRARLVFRTRMAKNISHWNVQHLEWAGCLPSFVGQRNLCFSCTSNIWRLRKYSFAYSVKEKKKVASKKRGCSVQVCYVAVFGDAEFLFASKIYDNKVNSENRIFRRFLFLWILLVHFMNQLAFPLIRNQ